MTARQPRELGSYADLLCDAADRYSDADALVFGNARLTYRDLLARAIKRTERLRAQGIGDGSWFEIRMPNGPEFVEHFLAGALVGAISVPIEPGSESSGTHKPANRRGVRAPPEDTLVIMQTSGTTGHPKQCMLSHRALVSNAQAIAERLGIRSGDRFWDPLPMTHLSGLMLMSAVLSAGGTFITTSRFDADMAFDQFEAERPTILYPVFPTVTQTLLGHPRFSAGSVEACERSATSRLQTCSGTFSGPFPTRRSSTRMAAPRCAACWPTARWATRSSSAQPRAGGHLRTST